MPAAVISTNSALDFISSMVPQPQYTTAQKYAVIQYIRETFLRPHNPSQLKDIDLAALPRGLARTEAEKIEVSRSQGRADQILMSLQELRGNPATPANVAAALEKMNDIFVTRFGKELKLVKDGAASGKYEHNVDFFYAESQVALGAVVRNMSADVLNNITVRTRAPHAQFATASAALPSLRHMMT